MAKKAMDGNEALLGVRWMMVGVWLALGAGGCDKGAVAVPEPPDTGVLDTPLWDDSSQSIDVTCFGYFQGSMRFVAKRDQLSPEQRVLLSAMRTVDAAPLCAADGLECRIVIEQGNGQSTTIESIEMDPACGQPRKLISFQTFRPFQETIACQHAKDLTFGATGTAPPVVPDVRCYNGLFTASAGNIAVALQVDDASIPRHLELDDCDQPGRAGKFLFAVSDNDGTTTIATSNPVPDPGVDHTCASADLTFPHPGLFNLTVSVTANPMPAGDFSLRFY